MSSINGVNSEIGPLKKVMLHRPGKEIDRLTLANKDAFLFDDLLWVEEAQREHDSFAGLLGTLNAKVVYLRNYLIDILNNTDVRENLIKDVLTDVPAETTLKRYLMDMLNELDTDNLVEILFCGLMKEELIHFSGIPASLTINSMAKNDFLIAPLPNLYFQRDPYVIVGNKVIICNMNFPARRRESLIGRYIFGNHSDFSDMETVFGNSEEDKFSGSLEGGDILVLSDKLLAIGISQRTSPGAIQRLGARLSKTGSCHKIIALNLPKTRSAMHLDTVLTMIDRNSFAIYKGIYSLLDIWQLDFAPDGKVEKLFQYKNLERCLIDNLQVENVNFYETGGGNPIQAEKDQWNDGANVFAVSPGKIITYERNTMTNKILKDAGINVLEIRGSELGRGRGGPRCMALPIAREDL